jgi:uncharacterized protein YPO0396
MIGRTDAGAYAEEYLEKLQQEKTGEIDAMRKSIEALQKEKQANDEEENKMRDELKSALETIRRLEEDKQRLNMKVADLEVTSAVGATETQQNFLSRMFAMIIRWDGK